MGPVGAEHECSRAPVSVQAEARGSLLSPKGLLGSLHPQSRPRDTASDAFHQRGAIWFSCVSGSLGSTLVDAEQGKGVGRVERVLALSWDPEASQRRINEKTIIYKLLSPRRPRPLAGPPVLTLSQPTRRGPHEGSKHAEWMEVPTLGR